MKPNIWNILSNLISSWLIYFEQITILYFEQFTILLIAKKNLRNSPLPPTGAAVTGGRGRGHSSWSHHHSHARSAWLGKPPRTAEICRGSPARRSPRARRDPRPPHRGAASAGPRRRFPYARRSSGGPPLKREHPSPQVIRFGWRATCWAHPYAIAICGSLVRTCRPDGSEPPVGLKFNIAVQGFHHWEQCCITCHVSGMYVPCNYCNVYKVHCIGETETNWWKRNLNTASFSLLPLFDHFLRLWLIWERPSCTMVVLPPVW
jgi:hypothetical protein